MRFSQQEERCVLQWKMVLFLKYGLRLVLLAVLH